MKQLMPIVAGLLIIFFLQCSSKNNYISTNPTKELNTQLPKVLFITTGINFQDKEKDLPKGIIVAIQTFNKRGIPVRLEPRDVLYDFDYLTQYNIIILSTAKGYHDGDRMYSLSYMTDAELSNLNKFVESGGVIIAGDHVGRNLSDGTDRILETQQLNPDNYSLSEVFGVTLKESNMRSYKICGDISQSLKGDFLSSSEEDLWTLVPQDIISDKLKVLASWQNDNDTLPAIIQNRYGKGLAFLLASSDFINPANSGGHWSVNQINDFYNYVADEYYNENNINISLNPWPNAYDVAFCVTFNANGEFDNYKYVVNRLNDLKIKPSFFVSGLINDTIKDFIKSNNINIASTGFHYVNFRNITYPIALNDILENEYEWDRKFKGFRFPYTSPNFTGLIAIDLHDYDYESSISVNNLEFMHGSVFPYNLVISEDKFYKSTNILEIGPIYHDDYFYLGKLMSNDYKNPDQLTEDIMLYDQYLQDFWKYSIKPYNGLMVYLGHPGLVGFNRNTFSALENLIDTVKQDNTWMTSIDEVADYRSKLEKFRFFVESKNNTVIIYVDCKDDISIENLTLNFKEKPQNAIVKEGDVSIKESNNGFSVIFDAFDGQIVKIER